MKTKTLQLLKHPMEIRVIDGIVSSNEKWTETHVSSHGGGGYINPQYGGHVSAAQVTSEVTSHRGIWVKDTESGLDVNIEIPGHIPVADGHRVICVEVEYKKSIWYTYFENTNSRKYWNIVEPQELIGAFTRKSIFRWMIFWSVVSFFTLAIGVNAFFIMTNLDPQNYDKEGIALLIGIIGLILFNAIMTGSGNSSRKHKKLAEYQAFVKEAVG